MQTKKVRGGKGPDQAIVEKGRGWVVKGTRLPDKTVKTGDFVKNGNVVCGACGSYKYDNGQCRNVKCKTHG